MRPGFALLRLATVAVGLACSFVAFTSAARAQESCPLNYLSFFYGRFTFYYPDAVKDTAFSSSLGFSVAGYDLVRGEIWARADVQWGSEAAEAGVSDDYTASGGAPGTPFTVRARLDLTGYTYTEPCTPYGHCSYASVQAILREGPSNEATYFASLIGTVAIEVTIQGMVGVPFRVFASALAAASSTGPSGGAQVTARLGFVDLPAGLRITSCQGYVLDGPVAVSRSTWGRLKSTYR